MERVGVADSIRGKLLLAVGIQFVVSIAQAVIPFVFSGWLRLEVTLAVFALAALAFGTTVLIVREDIVQPIGRLEEASTRIAGGELDVNLPDANQSDEIGQLVRSFGEMHASLVTVAEQAEALAAHEFDAPVLEREMPGRFGRSFDRMTRGLRYHIERIESDRDRFQLLNHLVGHDVPNLINIVNGRIDILRAKTDSPEAIEQVDIVDRQIGEIESICNTVGQLSSNAATERVDVTEVLADRAEHVRDSFPDGTVTTDLPDEPAEVWGNELLTTVFENLISNGVEHNDAPEPRVDVSAVIRGDSGSDSAGDSDAVVVRISDNGSGLDVDDTEAFFAQLDPGTGLHIVHTVVGRFGGDIEIEESGESGTTFRVTFPTAEPETEFDRHSLGRPMP
jgi:signal transduction histidine kinase